MVYIDYKTWSLLTTIMYTTENLIHVSWTALGTLVVVIFMLGTTFEQYNFSLHLGQENPGT